MCDRFLLRCRRNLPNYNIHVPKSHILHFRSYEKLLFHNLCLCVCVCVCVCGTNTDVSNLSYDFKYCRLHNFTINPLTTFKFWVPESWYVNSSILRTHNSGVTCVPHSYLALSARCTQTDTFFCKQREKAEIIRLEIVGSTVKIYASGDQAPVTFASLL